MCEAERLIEKLQAKFTRSLQKIRSREEAASEKEGFLAKKAAELAERELFIERHAKILEIQEAGLPLCLQALTRAESCLTASKMAVEKKRNIPRKAPKKKRTKIFKVGLPGAEKRRSSPKRRGNNLQFRRGSGPSGQSGPLGRGGPLVRGGIRKRTATPRDEEVDKSLDAAVQALKKAWEEGEGS